MSEIVTLRHPNLPAEQTIRVDRRRVGARLGAGWEEVLPAPAEKPAHPTTAVNEPAPKRPGRKTTEEQ